MSEAESLPKLLAEHGSQVPWVAIVSILLVLLKSIDEIRKSTAEARLKEQEFSKEKKKATSELLKRESSEDAEYPKYEPIAKSEWIPGLGFAIVNILALLLVGFTQPMTAMTLVYVGVSIVAVASALGFLVVTILLRSASYSRQVYLWVAAFYLDQHITIAKAQNSLREGP